MFTNCATFWVPAPVVPAGLKLWKPPAYRLAGTFVRLIFVLASAVLPPAAVSAPEAVGSLATKRKGESYPLAPGSLPALEK